jgi:phosphatidylglycerophosphate synthase
MQDIHFTYLMCAAFGATFALYGLRILLRGRARHWRAEQEGESVFLGKRFMEFGFWVTDPLVTLLHRARVTPDMVTTFSLVPGLFAGIAVSQGWFGLGCFLATAASFCDSIDGLLARRRGSGSDAGELFDAAVDRYIDLFFMGGLVVYYRFSELLCAVALLALCGAFLISYSTAKADALGVEPPRGAMRRVERAIYLNFAAGLTPLATLLAGPESSILLRQAPILGVTALIAVVANVSAARRFAAIMRALRARDAGRSAGAGAGVGGGATASAAGKASAKPLVEGADRARAGEPSQAP